MSPKASNNGVQPVTTNYSFPYMREANTNTKLQNFKLYLWNPQERTFLGRNKKSWAIVLTFYTVFFTCLAAFFAICMYGLLATLDDKVPKWTLEQSLIGVNPGLGFRPYSNRTEEGSLIWYNAQNATEVRKWVEHIDRFLDDYTNKEKLKGGGRNQVVCDFGQLPKDGQVCNVDITKWSPCVSNQSYSYDRFSPCFFLKLNKIIDWVPDYYDDPASLPKDMPLDLKIYIVGLPKEQRQQVWISCGGQDPADVEAIGPIEYINRGFQSYYYPYRNDPGYLSPLTVIRLARPTTERLINVECRAWAKNIQYIGGYKDRKGSVHFEILIDKWPLINEIPEKTPPPPINAIKPSTKL